MNVNLAPVLDVVRQAGNFDDEHTVAALAGALHNHDLNPGHFEIALRRVLALRDSLG